MSLFKILSKIPSPSVIVKNVNLILDFQVFKKTITTRIVFYKGLDREMIWFFLIVNFRVPNRSLI